MNKHTAASSPVNQPDTPQMPKAETKPRANTKKASSKAKKDENAPKRALSAYMFMSQEWRPKVKETNPSASFGEVGKLLGAKWKEMEGDEKKPYEEQAAADKARYEKEKKDYDASKGAEKSGDEEDEKPEKKSKKSTKKTKKEEKEEEEAKSEDGSDEE